MAIYYMNVQIIGRSAGRTATGAAAYRAGERIEDERTGRIFDYTRRQGEIEPQIFAPEGAPAWARDRAQLWNRAESAERRGDAQVVREMVVAFPKELNRDQQRELIRWYVQDQFVSQGMVADVAIHRNPGNPHAHVMLTMREIGPDGFSSKKNRDWNRPELLERWREEWASHANRALERAGREERINHKSLEEQGLERVPQVHMGPHAAALERRGVETVQGDHNRLVAEHNAVVVELDRVRAERQALQIEQAIQERTESRIRSGWFPGQAQASERLESLVGREMSEPDVLAFRKATRESLMQVNEEVRGILGERDRLESAQYHLQQHQEALNRLRPHESLLGVAKRLVSAEARQAHRQAVDRVDVTRREVERWGVRDANDLARQQGEWKHREVKLPGLLSRQDHLTGLLNMAEKALEGFRNAAERARRSRERDDSILRDLQRKVARSRDADRGR